MNPPERERWQRVLESSPLFEGVPAALQAAVLDALTVERWRRSKAVMPPRDTVHRFHLIVSGRVKITRQNVLTDREVTLFLLGPGDGFNVVSLLDGRRHDVYARTLDPVEALVGSTQMWNTWLNQDPDLRRAFRHYVDSQMRHLSDLAGDLALHDTMTRLARLILRYFDGDAETNGAGANLIQDLPHAELAHMIGTVRVVVNRLLAELKREGLVDTRGGKLQVLDLDRLLRKAEQHVQRSDDLSARDSRDPPR